MDDLAVAATVLLGFASVFYWGFRFGQQFERRRHRANGEGPSG